ncbi:MAG: hypothetical protein WCN81_14910, partial [Actinomycetes bacterium]
EEHLGLLSDRPLAKEIHGESQLGNDWQSSREVVRLPLGPIRQNHPFDALVHRIRLHLAKVLGVQLGCYPLDLDERY